MEDLDSGLLAIGLSDGDDSAPEAAEPSKIKIPGTARTEQSEEAFQAVQRGYTVKVENGEIWKEIRLPLGRKVAKPEAQALLHAVEELYFFRRYDEGAAFVKKVLDGEGGAGGLDKDTSKTLRYYQDKCEQKATHK
ncbi:hypothetical protein BKA67DRAFT_657874 [Truncatella angustata]|uniref:Uncharacterized protein n=1 Tax=Truncatella angustata TaxID=152316 RepID=A0A9P8UPL1_9PEZI|nr:uncharacterized protein BKA67DRAFT_657874 [Truncatella angustata]KAH6655980.1 hypothetical protein BKA67DRAFT_657874 [Truncatella angustata]KAH8201006.1 hypothetical protein TruAng_004865 [Truncatella angustata]